MNKIYIASIAALLAGCTSSGVATMGDGLYKVTATSITSFGGAASAKGSAFKTANAHCQQQGKHAVVVNDTTNSQLASGTADVTFKCAE